jgi:hypothetical protein
MMQGRRIESNTVGLGMAQRDCADCVTRAMRAKPHGRRFEVALGPAGVAEPGAIQSRQATEGLARAHST